MKMTVLPAILLAGVLPVVAGCLSGRRAPAPDPVLTRQLLEQHQCSFPLFATCPADFDYWLAADLCLDRFVKTGAAEDIVQGAEMAWVAFHKATSGSNRDDRMAALCNRLVGFAKDTRYTDKIQTIAYCLADFFPTQFIDKHAVFIANMARDRSDMHNVVLLYSRLSSCDMDVLKKLGNGMKAAKEEPGCAPTPRSSLFGDAVLARAGDHAAANRLMRIIEADFAELKPTTSFHGVDALLYANCKDIKSFLLTGLSSESYCADRQGNSRYHRLVKKSKCYALALCSFYRAHPEFPAHLRKYAALAGFIMIDDVPDGIEDEIKRWCAKHVGFKCPAVQPVNLEIAILQAMDSTGCAAPLMTTFEYARYTDPCASAIVVLRKAAQREGNSRYWDYAYSLLTYGNPKDAHAEHVLACLDIRLKVATEKDSIPYTDFLLWMDGALQYYLALPRVLDKRRDEFLALAKTEPLAFKLYAACPSADSAVVRQLAEEWRQKIPQWVNERYSTDSVKYREEHTRYCLATIDAVCARHGDKDAEARMLAFVEQAGNNRFIPYLLGYAGTPGALEFLRKHLQSESKKGRTILFRLCQATVCDLYRQRTGMAWHETDSAERQAKCWKWCDKHLGIKRPEMPPPSTSLQAAPKVSRRQASSGMKG